MINNLTKFKPLKTIELNTQRNLLLDQVLKIVNSNQEIQTLWLMTNVMAVKRMGITDHGFLHLKILPTEKIKDYKTRQFIGKDLE